MKNSDIKSISAIVLAAGLSARMGQNKLLLPFRGKPMLMHTVGLVESLGFGEKIIVTSRGTASSLQIPGDFDVVINESPEDGQSSSMKLGLNAAGLDYYMFFLADMPMLGEKEALKIISEIGGDKIIVPKSGATALNPVIFPKRFRNELLRTAGDKGGRGVISAHKAACKTVMFKDAEPFTDIDTPKKYYDYC